MNTLDAITLPDDLVWPDELEWLPVEQTTDYASGGSLIIQTGVKLAGRPINLSGLITRSVLLNLRALAATPAEHTLTFNGVTYTVRFRYADTAIAARELIGYADPDANDYYETTLRFIEV